MTLDLGLQVLDCGIGYIKYYIMRYENDIFYLIKTSLFFQVIIM